MFLENCKISSIFSTISGRNMSKLLQFVKILPSSYMKKTRFQLFLKLENIFQLSEKVQLLEKNELENKTECSF